MESKGSLVEPSKSETRGAIQIQAPTVAAFRGE
jgi:hypothetical protein